MPLTSEMKTELELIEELISSLMQGQFNKIALLQTLVNSSLLGAQKQEVEALLNTLQHYCSKGIENKDGNAIFLQGFLHHLGLGIPQNFKEAIRFYEQAIALNHSTAMSNRAYMYSDGKAGPVNFEEAFKLLNKAIALNDPCAMNIRACMYFDGKGGPVDFERAIKLYEQAIKLGNAGAMNGRALIYEKMGDFEKAIKLYEQAIELGSSSAMSNRAIMFLKGKGGPVNYEEAIMLLHQAIKLGSSTAMANRAHMYKLGQGGPIDLINAARLYRSAADMDLSAALARLNNPSKSIFYYHYLMQQNNMEEVVRLAFENPNLFNEFKDFDCPMLFKTKQFNRIKSFTDAFKALSTSTPSELNRLYVSILAIVEGCERELGSQSKDGIQLKKHYVKLLDLANMEEDDTINSLHSIINTWYDAYWNEDEDLRPFTQIAARLLKKGAYRIASLDKEEDPNFQVLSSNLILIIGKAHLGKDFKIHSENISSEQLFEFIATPSHKKWLEVFLPTQEYNLKQFFYKNPCLENIEPSLPSPNLI